MITPVQPNEPTPFRHLFSLDFDVMEDEFAIPSAIKRCIARRISADRTDRWCTGDAVIRDTGRIEVTGLYG
jgi:hypothetical protein